MNIKRRNFPTDTFPQRLRLMMMRKALSQSDIARELGYSTTGVWNWIQGNTFPRQETLAQLAAMLEIDEEWLREGDPKPLAEGGDTGDGSGKERLDWLLEELKLVMSSLVGCDPHQVKVNFEIGAS